MKSRVQAFTRDINYACLRHGLKLVAGQAEREGVLLIEDDNEFEGYVDKQNHRDETFLEEIK